jgi:hypothetical protein
MPLINGIKMACEPCIRGHRSTKCTHASERLMVPVRKPGRPLSTCPHPASRPCSCAAVTAAIPRRQKCHCGTSSSDSPDVKSETETPTPLDSTPASPTRAPPLHANRIQKAAHKGSSHSRLSIDASGLSRMDMNQLNIMSPSDSRPRKASITSNGQTTPVTGVATYTAVASPSTTDGFATQSMIFPMFPQSIPPSLAQPQTMNQLQNGQSISTTTGSPSTNGSAASHAAKSGGCCGGGGGGSSSATTTTIRTQPNGTATSHTNGASPVKSCCAPQTEPNSAGQNGLMQPTSDLKSNMIPNIPMPMSVPNGMYPYFPQPSIFAYPPHYGSYLQPLQPEQWRQVMTSLAMNHQHQPLQQQHAEQHNGSNGFTIPPAMAYPPPATPGGSAWTSHQCDCGESCQCVGCATHPYNEATQNYVRSAWNASHEDGRRMSVSANGVASAVTNSHHENGHGNLMNGGTATNGVSRQVTNSVEGTVSPTAPQTPSEGGSAAAEDQALSESDFFFVSYPFGDSCAGDTASCPCGDDCQCIGCVIHGNAHAV